MILDQGIGAHYAQLESFGLGGAWTWVSDGVSSSAAYGWLEYTALGRLEYKTGVPAHYDAVGRMLYGGNGQPVHYTALGESHFTPAQED